MNHLRWYAALVVLFFAGDHLGGLALQHTADQSLFRYGRQYAGQASADVLLIGNSRGLALYQPYIEQITGLKTFNMSYNGLPADAATALALDYLDRYPNLQKIIIDVTLCDRENDALLAGFLTYAKHSDRLNHLIKDKIPSSWWGAQVSHLFRFNHEIYQRALYYRNRSDEDWLLDRVISPELAATAGEHNYDLDVSKYLIEQLHTLVDSAKAKGIGVTLLIGPYFPGFQVNNLDALKDDIEKTIGTSVKDYRFALSNPAYFGDFMHPNKSGSMAFIDFLRRDGVFD